MIVLQAHDVILAEIAARLNLDQMQRNLAGVFQMMDDPQRNEGRLLFRQQHLRAVPRDARRAGNLDPMLGAVMVKLQRESLARLDHEALDLEARARIDSLVPAPRPTDSQMGVDVAASIPLPRQSAAG